MIREYFTLILSQMPTGPKLVAIVGGLMLACIYVAIEIVSIDHRPRKYRRKNTWWLFWWVYKEPLVSVGVIGVVMIAWWAII